jgi:hypothetical protein
MIIIARRARPITCPEKSQEAFLIIFEFTFCNYRRIRRKEGE